VREIAAVVMGGALLVVAVVGVVMGLYGHVLLGLVGLLALVATGGCLWAAQRYHVTRPAPNLLDKQPRAGR
jgi:hypothetical protein